LRVSGKHNDLEEVGHDTYHHTMFEMLGNWSFGDYFKKDAIEWAWEYLTEVLKIDKNRLYVTIFEGDKAEGLERDTEAYDIWAKHIDVSRIINGNKKDNFWEMGDTGPCGPCSEIHVDIRNDEDRKKVDGKTLVNASDPLVIEIWNNVFMQYNRKANGQLELLPAQHVDTGMGFERLCMVVQGKQSNYDTDVFTPIINEISRLANIEYGKGGMTDIAMRVIADHLRAVSFAIADGQLPSNNKAGYVIRRILRRAVRYAYTYLNQTDPFMCKLVPVLAKQMGGAFPELKSQEQLIIQVIAEEEHAFLKTLATGIKLLEQIINKTKNQKETVISGKSAFELYDTFGFPLDLTELILREQGLAVNRDEFDAEMQQQKSRSRYDAAVETDDWQIVNTDESAEFLGYDTTEAEVKIARYRKVTTKGKNLYHLIFNKTPFYAESGGQVGDSGVIVSVNETIEVIDTKKENNLSIHIVEKLPSKIDAALQAKVHYTKRFDTASNHSATHLMHEALRDILGKHVEQKGSLVNSEYLRFDFSHFQKLTEEEIKKVEQYVNNKIRQNIKLDEHRQMPYNDAIKLGAMALFGEKYGSNVRVVKFGDSVELCGGTHVAATGQIGFFKIVSESAIAAGIRRIEAITGSKVQEFIDKQAETINQLKALLNNPQDLKKSIEALINEKADLQKKLEVYTQERLGQVSKQLVAGAVKKGNITIVAGIVEVSSANDLKEIAYQIKGQVENLYLALGAEAEGKACLAVMISENLTKEKNLNAGAIIRDIAKEVDGGGGGQPFFATAGGKNPKGLSAAIEKAKNYIN
jgi:alanyl-tRNA synthetase